MFKESLRPDTSLVSIMMVNNEIGVRQPVEEIGNYCYFYIIPIIFFMHL